MSITIRSAAEAAFAVNLAKQRAARQWTQRETAEQSHHYGLTWDARRVASIESGEGRASIDEVLLCCGLFEVALEQLIGSGNQVQIADAIFEGCEFRDLVLSGVAKRESQSPVRNAISETERKLARRLGIAVQNLDETAKALWGTSLVAERERRLFERGTEPSKRGWVTRELCAELEQHLNDNRSAYGWYA